MTDESGAYECALCGATYETAPEGFLGLDVESHDGTVENHWYPGFCSTEHAAAWFSRPLPHPDAVYTWEPHTAGADWRFWGGVVGGLALGLAVLALAAVGTVSLLG
ncbi:hypothetical protein ACFUMH_08985 [Cellulomonas sp. NPDC057328]|uniref:hypothetical protein n=1 Tax=Cellulomonas sp. NPDC057328 TaxID=3346101 RepID=UPI003635C409